MGMSMQVTEEKRTAAPRTPGGKSKAKTSAPPSPASVPAPSARAPFYHRADWLAFGLTALLVMAGYLATLAPDVTLEDSGEMAVAAQYGGIPHSPGYPVWTVYSWLFIKLLPVSNIAWRVAVGSAVAGALACGLIALMVSRSSQLAMAGSASFHQVEERWRVGLSVAGGFVAGALMGFNGFMWSQAVIVEVYTLSVLSLTATMASLFRWMHRTDQRRWLYLTWLLFGVCFTNHQSLLLAALAIEVCVAAADARLGRDLFLGNVLCYAVGLFAKAQGWTGLLSDNGPLLKFYHAVGLGSLAALVWLAFKTRGLGRRFPVALGCAGAFVVGASPYLWMPVMSMANPPMNWAYPRTVEGFVHALTRGQYERVQPVTDALQYGKQLWQVAQGAMQEFHPAFLLLGLLPLLLYKRLGRRERGWLSGGVAFYLALGPMLLVLLNPGSDRASQGLVKVFFAASHVLVAMAIGLGAALGAALLSVRLEQVRRWALAGAGVALVWGGIEVVSTWSTTQLALARWTALFGLGLAAAAAVHVALARARLARVAVLATLGLMPMHSVLSHWWPNEQRGHLFGFWFGHDMFTPPFKGTDGQLTYSRAEREQAQQNGDGSWVYPEMSRKAVLFGGTDPGRFCPTYMIFCESFLKPEQRRDPEFDRRDVYLITQNALADPHYLEYIRAHYNRSAQHDPLFFSEMLRGATERSANDRTNFLARLALPLDRALANLGAHLEQERRAVGVYPAAELQLPTEADRQRCMHDYARDLQARAARGQLKPGEAVRVVGNHIQFSGQTTVMGINALLAREIFEKNPSHEFFVEESFPLDWMYPHLEPFGVIMKLNRRPAAGLSVEVVERDRRFWRDYMGRLIGDWVKPETNVAEICAFAERTHVRRDLSAYAGDVKFLRDEAAQKSFSKLRSSIGGLYDWRFREATGQLQQVSRQLAEAGLNAAQAESLRAEHQRLATEQARMYHEAEFAYKQAYALCPYSPEAFHRLVNLLLSAGRVAEALALAEVTLKLDPGNAFYTNVAAQLRQMKPSAAPGAPPRAAAQTARRAGGPLA
jgi:tetratricopeptide (TPR) repeat protein